MHIVSFKPAHDGSVACLRDGQLEYLYEAEKDSGPRHSRLYIEEILDQVMLRDARPDVLCISGWNNIGGYNGIEASVQVIERHPFFGGSNELVRFASSHERSHLFCSFGLSPFPEGQPCYALNWEGVFGSFYEIGADLAIRRLGTPLTNPGARYAMLYFLANKDERKFTHNLSDAGKLMALAAFSPSGPPTADEKRTIDFILDIETRPGPSIPEFFLNGRQNEVTKEDFAWCPYRDVGVEDPGFKSLVRKFSDALFDRFHSYARQHLTKRLPLIIGGGCGLNCEWNSAWRDSGLFEDVFVPPCTNDSGSALGTAIEAQHALTGRAKIGWSVYSGKAFVVDSRPTPEFVEEPLDLRSFAAWLAQGNIAAWVQGRYEMGPRALGNRSLIAAPFAKATLDRLNDIKQRENYRPIAPICAEERFRDFFDGPCPSPYMLYFQRVKSDRLQAVTHVDGSARVQTVNREQNPRMHSLLTSFGQETGVPVLCNTSLNFKGRGFINRMSDLVAYCIQRGIDGFVVGDVLYRRSSDSSKNGGTADHSQVQVPGGG